ncbi:hypothetical protein RRG08_020275 [Elysia crispata]|uniref:Uncharacterized protein n=1 Tax=Elysia crispata TaxID=231223 RepID=A0AAE0YY51_9GAST|nr:hypothetical protein RRG08_020275 [Elysia crispata]
MLSGLVELAMPKSIKDHPRKTEKLADQARHVSGGSQEKMPIRKDPPGLSSFCTAISRHSTLTELPTHRPEPSLCPKKKMAGLVGAIHTYKNPR